MGNLKAENVKINTCYGKREGKREIPSEKEQILRMINFNDRRQMERNFGNNEDRHKKREDSVGSH